MFFLSAAVIGLPRHSMNMLRIRHLITKYIIDSHFLKKRFPYVFLSVATYVLSERKG